MPIHDIKCKDCTEITSQYVSFPVKNTISCLKCKSDNTFIYYGNYKSAMFAGINYVNDVSNYGNKISTADINRKCREEGLVYGSQEEIQREAKRYKRINEQESKKRDAVLVDKIEHEFKKRGA